MKRFSKTISMLLMALMLFYATPVFAGSTASTASDLTVGEDTAQGAVTAYGTVGEGNANTDVYLTVDNNNIAVGVPTEIVISGTPNSSGEYIGEYSVSVEGDIAGNYILTVEPESDTVALMQTGKSNTTASITQDQVTFDCNDLANNTKTQGRVSATSLTAGSWSGEFSMLINLKRTYSHSITDITSAVFANTNINGGNLVNYYSNIEATECGKTTRDVYAIPVSELKLNAGDTVVGKNDNSSYSFYFVFYDKGYTRIGSWQLVSKSSTTDVTIPDGTVYMGVCVKDSRNIPIETNDIPVSDFTMYKDTISENTNIDYIDVWDKQMSFDEKFLATENRWGFHNTDFNYRTGNADVFSGNRSYGFWDVDLQKTSDGYFVNAHDTTATATDGTVYTISACTLEELKNAFPNECFTVDEIIEFAKAQNAHVSFQPKATIDTYWGGFQKTMYNKMVEHNYYNIDLGFESATSKAVENSSTNACNIFLFFQTPSSELLETCKSLYNNNDIFISFSNGITVTSEQVQEFMNEDFKIIVSLGEKNVDLNRATSIVKPYVSVFDKVYSIILEDDSQKIFVSAAVRNIKGL